MRKTLCSLALVGTFAVSCSNNTPVLSTQLDHVVSGALLSCDPYPQESGEPVEDPHTCLVLSNPLLPLLRVYNASQREFLLAPLGYSPLAVRLDGLTIKTASFDAPGRSYAFTLDANASTVSAINARNGKDATPSFSVAHPLPKAQLLKRSTNLFVVDPKSADSISLLIIAEDGSVQKTKYQESEKKFDDVVFLGPALGMTVLDSAYDPFSKLLALLVSSEGKTKVVVRKVSDDAQLLSATPYPVQDADLGNVKMAIGTMNTNGKDAPHLFLMKQDLAELRTIRLDLESPALDNTIKLNASVTKAYFPEGPNKEACCDGREKNWMTVASNDGAVYFLSDNDLTDKDASKKHAARLSFSKRGATTDYGVSELEQIVGGDVRILRGDKAPKDVYVCPRQMFFIFASGYVGAICEGQPADITKIVGR